MKLLRQILNDIEAKERRSNLTKLSIALEHQTYKLIPGTRNSYRVDPQNTNTTTQRHVHVYAKPNGAGNQLYSVNLDGSGHDGSSGTLIPVGHAEYFRSIGFTIPDNLALESIDIDGLDPEIFEICILEVEA